MSLSQRQASGLKIAKTGRQSQAVDEGVIGFEDQFRAGHIIGTARDSSDNACAAGAGDRAGKGLAGDTCELHFVRFANLGTGMGHGQSCRDAASGRAAVDLAFAEPAEIMSELCRRQSITVGQNSPVEEGKIRFLGVNEVAVGP